MASVKKPTFFLLFQAVRPLTARGREKLRPPYGFAYRIPGIVYLAEDFANQVSC
jgi:hypothetical protein